ncbi:MAG TPA: DUF2158 domain-containing protein [Bradyrhizobium sp.]|nr:DUF2158 domain-containing protein [Bradyrhizobium sp.]
MIPVSDLYRGAVVRLVSGSPKMTVTGLGPEASPPGNTIDVRVAWMSDGGELQRAVLSSELLTWPAARIPKEGDAE